MRQNQVQNRIHAQCSEEKRYVDFSVDKQIQTTFICSSNPRSFTILCLHSEAMLKHKQNRYTNDIDALPSADWVIDAAANPSVLAGVDGVTSSRQVVEHNL